MGQPGKSSSVMLPLLLLLFILGNACVLFYIGIHIGLGEINNTNCALLFLGIGSFLALVFSYKLVIEIISRPLDLAAKFADHPSLIIWSIGLVTEYLVALYKLLNPIGTVVTVVMLGWTTGVILRGDLLQAAFAGVVTLAAAIAFGG